MLEEKFLQNASKFAIFYILFENPRLLFQFFVSCYFCFFPNECPGLCSHRPGHSLGGKIKWHEMKNATLGFRMFKIWQNLKHFASAFHQA